MLIYPYKRTDFWAYKAKSLRMEGSEFPRPDASQEHWSEWLEHWSVYLAQNVVGTAQCKTGEHMIRT